MNLLAAAVDRHPALVVLAVVVAACLFLYGVDAFIGAAERDRSQAEQ